MPSVPFFESHGVVIELLVKILKKGYCLNNHCVDFIGRESEGVSADTVG